MRGGEAHCASPPRLSSPSTTLSVQVAAGSLELVDDGSLQLSCYLGVPCRVESPGRDAPAVALRTLDDTCRKRLRDDKRQHVWVKGVAAMAAAFHGLICGHDLDRASSAGGRNSPLGSPA